MRCAWPLRGQCVPMGGRLGVATLLGAFALSLVMSLFIVAMLTTRLTTPGVGSSPVVAVGASPVRDSGVSADSMALAERVRVLEKQMGAHLDASQSALDLVHRKLFEARRALSGLAGKSTLEEEVVFLSYASHGGSDDRFCRCVESVLYAGFRYHLLGWQSKFESLNDKLFGQILALKSIPDDTIVVFADAYDVLVTGSPHEVVARYRAFDSPVVFGAEKGCWPFIQFSVAETALKITGGKLTTPHKPLPPTADGAYLCATHYPPSPTNQRYM